jgi:ABC-2 type transport system ATP-binding protein
METRSTRAESLPDPAVSCRGLDKTYRPSGRGQAPKHALRTVDLDIPRGSIFGLLGPNGAGKSTFINILAGLVVKSGGSAEIWGHDIDSAPRAARAAIGVVPQELNLDAFFTPQELLELQAGLYGVPKSRRRTKELLELVGLADRAKAYARTLSGGMRRRLMVAKAMVHSPPVLVLDEPTAGVDVELRQALWENIRALNRDGVTVILTTHYLEEAEQLCDTIAIIQGGELIARDSTEQMLRRLDGKELRLHLDSPLAELPPGLEEYSPKLAAPDLLVLTYRPTAQRIDAILARLSEAGIGIRDLSTVESDLEDVFLALIRGGEE